MVGVDEARRGGEEGNRRSFLRTAYLKLQAYQFSVQAPLAYPPDLANVILPWG